VGSITEMRNICKNFGRKSEEKRLFSRYRYGEGDNITIETVT
jgi:hypothetical protein